MNKNGFTVHIGAVRAYLDECCREGLNRNSLRQTIQVDELLLGDGTARVSLETFSLLLSQAGQWTKNPMVHLEAGARFPPGTFGALQYLLQSRNTFRDCLKDVVKYGSVISDYASYSLTEEGGVARFQKKLHVPSKLIPQDTSTFCMAAVVSSTRQILGLNWNPIEVRLQRPSPSDVSAYAQFFGCPVRFNSSTDEVILSPHLLNQPLLTRDIRLAEVIEVYLGNTSGFSRVGLVSDLLVDWLKQHLATGAIDLSLAAQSLGLSSRGLQRHLAEENTSYQLILDGLRKELAHFYVLHLGLLNHEVSLRLGFSDERSFFRAFRRWYSCTPAEYKANSSGRM